ncbi:hypothetical protein BGW38_002932 [Lunasporangiospora selenospora]|uniref:MD-2-related lipid-recognition domain-containing protein n=1 Tax=Lunasporangiospora selenospora TaxID=979761 RepID=A0A9P6FRP0_9FUNG|nr:hypothetical protein BGW38_002932 [Lunasporangiospora selenospora]
MTGLSWTPSPACVGKPLCITVSGILNNDIVDGGVVSMIGRYFGRVVYTDDYLLCDFLAANGMTCPIPVTTTTATFCHTIKPEAPTGIPVEMTYEFVNGNGNILYCEKTIGAMAMNC